MEGNVMELTVQLQDQTLANTQTIHGQLYYLTPLEDITPNNVGVRPCHLYTCTEFKPSDETKQEILGMYYVTSFSFLHSTAMPAVEEGLQLNTETGSITDRNQGSADDGHLMNQGSTSVHHIPSFLLYQSLYKRTLVCLWWSLAGQIRKKKKRSQ